MAPVWAAPGFEARLGRRRAAALAACLATRGVVKLGSMAERRSEATRASNNWMVPGSTSSDLGSESDQSSCTGGQNTKL